jgi:hypothetical protein
MNGGNGMHLDWQALMKMTGGKEISVEKVKVKNTGVQIEGSFDLPPLAQLSLEDQVFAATFIKSHGSIKEMERLYGISYPTVKNRLNKIAEQLDFVDVDVKVFGNAARILDRLDRGEISVDQALEEMT